jgi:hypothetical protein
LKFVFVSVTNGFVIFTRPLVSKKDESIGHETAKSVELKVTCDQSGEKKAKNPPFSGSIPLKWRKNGHLWGV